MSNLSDLLPAGAGAKSATFTADGTLATGTTVILQSDGTVSAVAETTQSASAGTATQITSNRPGPQSAIYDPSSGKVVFIYVDELNSNYITAAVGTISGTSISFGTPVVSSSNSADSAVAAYDSSTEQILIAKRLTANQYGYACVGTVSGTSISFGSVYNFTNFTINGTLTVSYDTNANAFMIAYSDSTNSDRGAAKVATVSGTVISYGSQYIFSTGQSFYFSSVYEPVGQKIVLAWGTPNALSAKVVSISGTTISYGTQVTISSGSGNYEFHSMGYDTQSGKIVIGYEDRGNSLYGTAKVGTLSGTSTSWGSAVVFRSANTGNAYFVVGYDAGVGRTNIFFRIYSPSDQGLVATGTVSGTSITFDSNFTVSSDNRYVGAAYDSVAKKWGYGVRPGANDYDGLVFTTEGTITNLTDTNFVGITDEAIADTATGSVVVEGGVITNSTLVPDVPSVTAGSVGLTSDTGQHMGAAYDASADRVVAAYRDNNNSYYGTAAVGTVSGTSISFGTPVVFQSANVTQCKVAYDSTNELTFIAYNNNTSSRGTARYGAVSGTTIDFSVYNPVVFDSDAVADLAVAHDSNAGKMVIAYGDGGNSYKGTAVVGSLSGTTLTFGTAVVYNSGGASNKNSMAYDANAQKVVISYGDGGNSNYPTSIVGTVSGTSISFGSETVIANVSGSYTATTYDSGNQKIVVSYQDGSDSNAGKAAVGTVSGTSITFGTPVAFAESLAVGAWLSSAYDSNNGVVVFNFKNNSGNAGTCLPAVVDGTSFSYGSSVVFESGSTEYTNTVYDTTAQKFVVVYNDGGGGDLGSAVVLSPSVTTGLTTGSTYYVQDDGSLSTTSSSVTAGKALSSTTLLLKG